MLIILIMIDVKLTPSGGPPTYLYEWVDGVHN